MGRSGKPPIAYRLQDHIAFIDGFIDALGLDDIVFVLHDWGVAIGLHFLARFPEQVRAVAFMEGHLHPIERWSDMEPGAEVLFRQVRSADGGRRLVLEENFFVERVLPSGVRRTLSAEEMDADRAPFRRPGDREPIWRFACEIPIEGDPADVGSLLENNLAALSRSSVPKLLCYAEPGAVIRPSEVAWCRSELMNLTALNLGPGIHFLPEDYPDEIGQAIAAWLDRSFEFGAGE
jgi:haloalkane dehalogenase